MSIYIYKYTYEHTLRTRIYTRIIGPKPAKFDRATLEMRDHN